MDYSDPKQLLALLDDMVREFEGTSSERRKEMLGHFDLVCTETKRVCGQPSYLPSKCSQFLQGAKGMAGARPTDRAQQDFLGGLSQIRNYLKEAQGMKGRSDSDS